MSHFVSSLPIQFQHNVAGGASCSHGGQGQLWPTEQAGDHGDDVDDGSGQRDGESGDVVIVRDKVMVQHLLIAN